ncbi:unnamed protein product [Polarella glacialis]|uniref:RNA-polymerase II-associated protein 3-like C-terminal domain-containing protein n=1 Tax=Polarella glacialis TaxID=89957 RepID=A0A813DVJ6_POLGL|nr:unnamed protein product [Polarella glacialis]CAE8659275.1 unnamed protein product [Polarella glacialis]
MAAMAAIAEGCGRPELMRGMPNFRKETPPETATGSVNPVPASVQRNGVLPRNGHELARELKRQPTPQDKVLWLAEMGDDAYARIFRVELDCELLQTILAAMHSAICGNAAKEATEDESGEPAGCAAAAAARKTLGTLARACPKGLEFAAGFAGAKERSRAKALLRALEEQGGEESAAELGPVRRILLGDA